MADFSIESLDAIQAGTAVADTLGHVANVARNSACGFFKAYPSVVIPNPAFDFLDAIWDGLCAHSQPGLPPAPSPPFPGGQCHCTLYSIAWNYTWTSFGVPQSPVSGSGTAFGEIGAPIPVTYAPNGHVIGYNLPTHGVGATGCVANVLITTLAGVTSINDNITSFSFEITGGSPDNCGSLPSVYPPPVTPPTPITPGGNTYNLPPVSISLANGNTFNVTPTLNLNAPFAPTVQVGGINISVGGGGVTVSPPSLPPSNANNQDLGNLIGQLGNAVAGIAGNLGNGTIAGGGVGAAAAKAAANTAPPPPPGGPGTQPPVTNPPSMHTNTGVSHLSSVQIVLTTLPTRRDTIFASDPDYNVYIAGWFSWLQGTFVLQRIPIQYEHEIFFVVPGADGYTYTLTNGAAGYSIVSQTQPPT